MSKIITVLLAGCFAVVSFAAMATDVESSAAAAEAPKPVVHKHKHHHHHHAKKAVSEEKKAEEAK